MGTRCKERFCEAIGENNYKTWIEPLEFGPFEDGVAHFNVPTNFIGNWVNRNFGDQILHHLHRARRRGPSIAVRRQCPTGRRAAPAPTQPAQSDASRARRRRRQSARTCPAAAWIDRFTFDSFVVGKPNELAHAAARRVAEGGPVTFNPLFLYGGVGLGKTHLMHAIAWELREQRSRTAGASICRPSSSCTASCRRCATAT